MKKITMFLLASLSITTGLLPFYTGGQHGQRRYDRGSSEMYPFQLKPGEMIKPYATRKKEFIISGNLQDFASEVAKFAELVTRPQEFIAILEGKEPTNTNRLLGSRSFSGFGREFPYFVKIQFSEEQLEKLTDAKLKQKIKNYRTESKKREKKIHDGQKLIQKNVSKELQTNRTLQQMKSKILEAGEQIKKQTESLIEKHSSSLSLARTEIVTQMQNLQNPVIARINQILRQKDDELKRIKTIDGLSEQLNAYEKIYDPLKKQFDELEANRQPLLKKHLLPALQKIAKRTTQATDELATIRQQEKRLRTLMKKYKQKTEEIKTQITHELVKLHVLPFIDKQNKATKQIENTITGVDTKDENETEKVLIKRRPRR